MRGGSPEFCENAGFMGGAERMAPEAGSEWVGMESTAREKGVHVWHGRPFAIIQSG